MISLKLNFTNTFDKSYIIQGKNIPSIPTIYIWGIQKDSVFCPLYVGQTLKLKERLHRYYAKEIFATRELYDLTSSIRKIYDAIEWYNIYHLQPKEKKKNTFIFNFQQNVNPPNELIWFNKSAFFNLKIGNGFQSEYFGSVGQDFSLYYDLIYN